MAGIHLVDFDFRINNERRAIPEDSGMIQLAKGSLRRAPSRLHYLAYVAVPLLVFAAWFVVRRGRRSRLAIRSSPDSLASSLAGSEPDGERQEWNQHQGEGQPEPPVGAENRRGALRLPERQGAQGAVVAAHEGHPPVANASAAGDDQLLSSIPATFHSGRPVKAEKSGSPVLSAAACNMWSHPRTSAIVSPPESTKARRRIQTAASSETPDG